MKRANQGFGFGVTELRAGQCKFAAHQLLQATMAEAPDEIDLVAIAYLVGRLRIEDGGLERAEGRIVAPSPESGTIRVKTGMNAGRRRFTIAHEIGHFVLHPRESLDRTDTAANFTVWNDASEEAEANIFAAELIMPEFMFMPRCMGPIPSLRLIDELAAAFLTSTLATAFQYVSYTNEQVALVLSEGEQIRWSYKSKDFWPRIRRGNLSPDSAAGEIAAGNSGDTNKMVETPAHAWLTEFDYDNEHDIREDSRYVGYYDRIISLLWLEEDLEE
jgi:hypothetical protein